MERLLAMRLMLETVQPYSFSIHIGSGYSSGGREAGKLSYGKGIEEVTDLGKG